MILSLKFSHYVGTSVKLLEKLIATRFGSRWRSFSLVLFIPLPVLPTSSLRYTLVPWRPPKPAGTGTKIWTTKSANRRVNGSSVSSRRRLPNHSSLWNFREVPNPVFRLARRLARRASCLSIRKVAVTQSKNIMLWLKDNKNEALDFFI